MEMTSIREALDRMDAYAQGIAEPGYYLEGYLDEISVTLHGGSEPLASTCALCEECAEKAAFLASPLYKAQGEDPPRVIPHPLDEEDGSVCCEGCACVLDYDLTVYGVDAEIMHFSECPPEVPIGKREAYQIARVIEAVADEMGIEDRGRSGRSPYNSRPMSLERRKDLEQFAENILGQVVYPEADATAAPSPL